MIDHCLRESQILLENRSYKIYVLQKVRAPEEAVRLVVAARLPNQTAVETLRVCIRAIRRHTTLPYELWIVDNRSHKRYSNWLLREDDINVVLNTTRPIPPEGRGWYSRLWHAAHPFLWGSYENAIALEIAVRMIDPNSKHLMSLHMDTMPCRAGWLGHLLSKIGNGVGAAGVRMDCGRTPEGVLHPLGCLIDFSLFQELNLDFYPRLPQHDVGDRITVRLRAAGYEVVACPNTLHNPELEERFSPDSVFRNFPVDRALDDEGNVIFLHLGRGTRKAFRGHRTGVTSQEWLKFAYRHVLP